MHSLAELLLYVFIKSLLLHGNKLQGNSTKAGSENQRGTAKLHGSVSARS